MAGGTKCYEVKRDALGKLWWTVVERNPKFADSPKEAAAKLHAGQLAYVRFHQVSEVEQEFEHSRAA